MTQSSTSAYDHLLKILLIGDASSNKRSLLRTYLEDQDISDTTTLGVCVGGRLGRRGYGDRSRDAIVSITFMY